MKYILIFIAALILFSCSAPRYVVQDVNFELKNGKVKITQAGPAAPLTDTVMTVKMIRKK